MAWRLWNCGSGSSLERLESLTSIEFCWLQLLPLKLDRVLVNPDQLLLFHVSVAAEDLRESMLEHFDIDPRVEMPEYEFMDTPSERCSGTS